MDKFLGNNYWHTRITKNVELTEIETFIKTITKTYLICKETLPRVHFHCCIQTQLSEKELRALILKSSYGGRGQYQLTVAKNVKQMKKYILKDGDYVYGNMNEKEIETLRKCSNKKGLDNFGKELQLLEEKYLGTDNHMFSQFAFNFVKLKISYGQNLYGNHIKAYLNKMRCKRDPNYIREYVNELMR